MEMREWLSIIVIVVLILIILDGFRRRWIDRKNRVILKIDKSLPSKGAYGDDTNPELPGSGVRTSSRSDLDEYYGSNEQSEESDNYNDDEAEAEADAGVEYYEDTAEQTNEVFQRIEPSFSTEEYENEYTDEEGDSDDNSDEVEPDENDLEESVTVAREDDLKLESILFTQPDLLFDDGIEDHSDVGQLSEVIVINVMAKKPHLFQGKAMLPILLQLGMRLGDMSIFHRHADSNGEGPIMFSMANIVEPGIFEMGSMDDFSTPGISFFLQLPNSLGNMESFEKMLEATNTLKEKLGGELKDENRSVITRQTIEHCRQRIRDFELTLLANK